MSHPQVVDAAVFGIPHDEWGEEVKAVVRVTEEATEEGTELELPTGVLGQAPSSKSSG
jgi:acyl-CoA synthetase (AMP-forming)/AMP-acid ligase II